MVDQQQSKPQISLVRREGQVISRLETLVETLARRWMALLSVVNAAIFTTIVLVILGLSSPVQGLSPISIAIHQYPLPFAGVSGILLTLTIVAFVMTRGARHAHAELQVTPISTDSSPAEAPSSTAEVSWRQREQKLAARAAGATGLATVSTLAMFGLLFTVLARLPWCPSSLCPSGLSGPVGPHDATIEVRLTAIQSDYYVLTRNPDSYGLNNLPTSIAAAPTDQPTAAHPYRVALSVHDLQNSGYPIIIEAVSVTIVGVPAMPSPLNVYATTAPGNYQTNIYQAQYDGAQPGASLSALYANPPGGGMQLSPSESDELVVQIVSHLAVDLQFQIAITYRIANQTPLHTFIFPSTFEVVFAPSTSWQSYVMVGGRLTPQR